MQVTAAATPTLDAYRKSFAAVRSATEKDPVTPDSITTTLRTDEQEAYAVVTHKLLNDKDPKLADNFAAQLPEAVQKFKGNHAQQLDMFKVADRVMRGFERKGLITQTEYVTMKKEAFGKCQFDGGRTWLDSKKAVDAASGDTPVRAISTALTKFGENKPLTEGEFQVFRAREAEISRSIFAEKKANGTLGQRKSVKNVTGTGATGENSAGTAVAVTEKGVPAGFLWKPTSDSDGRLVILLPPSVTGKAVKVEVLAPGGGVLAEGRYSGIGNGGRQHYRFSQSGGNFPDGTVVRVTLSDGSQGTIRIPESSSRIEGS